MENWDLSLSIFLRFRPIKIRGGIRMFKLNRRALKLFAVVVGSLSFVGCTAGEVSSSFGNSASGVNAPPVGSSNGIADPNSFYVGVDNVNNDIVHVHQTGAFGANCSIPKTAYRTDVDCTIDIPEGELFQHGLTMVYNMPPGMCRYLGRKTYWFYNYPIGFGPSSIVLTRTFLDGNLSAANCTIDGVASASCSNSEISIDPTTLDTSCIYKQTTGSGKNGCLGTYSLSVITTNNVTGPPASTVTTTTSNIMSWGGSIGNVLGGAGKYGWAVSSSGVPLHLISTAHLGILKEQYKIPAPIDSVATNTTLEIANDYAPADHTHRGFVSTRITTMPYYMDPVDDLDGSILPTTQDTYDFECLDQAYEILNRVKVKVREWDSYQDYVNYVESKGTTVVPDRRTDPEGTGPSCIGIYGPCNDFYDADDFVASITGGYTTVSPTDFNRRSTYFPKIIYK